MIKMTEKEDTNRYNSSNKNLLYSEILNISVTDRVHELLQKKNRSFTTHHVQRSAVLDRVSKILQSYKAGEDKNVEEIEEGKPVINMSVTLIEKSESVSEDDSENEDLEENDAKGKIILCSDSESEHEDLENDGVKITLYSDSESEQSKNKSLIDESGSNSCDSDSDETYESMKYLISSDLVSKLPEIRKFKCEDICASSSDTDDEQPENSDDEQSESEGKDVTLAAKTLHIPSESNDETPEEGNKVNVEGNNYLEPSQSDFGLLISDLSVPKCKYQGYKHDLGLYGKSKKLISVIEDDENISISKKQKRV